MVAVCAVTVTYGDRFDIFCRSTIERALHAGAHRVVVVDNGSSDPSAGLLQMFSQRCAQVTVISSEHNEGSAIGFGTAMQAAYESGADFLWLLDDDNWVEPTSLGDLLDLQSSAADHFNDPLIAVCASRSLNSFHKNVQAGLPVHAVYPPAGAFLSFDLSSYLKRKVRRSRILDNKFPSIPYAPYGGLLLPRLLLEQVGLPLRELVLYADDTHWTSQIVELGHRIVLATGVQISDADAKWLTRRRANSVGSSMLTNAPDRLYLSTRNRVWFDYRRLHLQRQRIRYAVNRTVVMSVAWHAARRGHSMQNFQLFRRATQHAEAGRFDCSPTLASGGRSAEGSSTTAVFAPTTREEHGDQD